jgi:branched-chain amino acid aminotransferase
MHVARLLYFPQPTAALESNVMADASLDLAFEPSQHSRLPADLTSAEFSSVVSDHMLIATYSAGSWQRMTIKPYGPLSLPPAISALQYGISVFEGLKAHRTPDGDIAIFRPRDNARRLNRSAARLAMPPFPEDAFVHGLRELVRLDCAWVPQAGQGALYVRPCLFSTDTCVRVKPADEYTFLIFTFPYGSYYSAPLDVLVAEEHVRAFPGGTGAVKAAGNYAPALVMDIEARRAGFHTVMWLDGVHRKYVEECGVMNVFFVIDDEIVTPALNGSILPGVTRDSALTLLREMGFSVVERLVSIDEVLSAHQRGSLRECFGTGTVANLTQVRRIRYRGHDIVLPPAEQQSVGASLRDRLIAAATGQLPDVHGWLEKV